MQPTTKLRFVERQIFVPFENYKDVVQPKTVRILQQWWEEKPYSRSVDGYLLGGGGEWRDIPIEKE
jgi:hypothetical protein